MPTVVSVRFREAGKLYYFDPCDLHLRRLDKVVVETSVGQGLGRVVTEALEKSGADVPLPLRRVLRKASPADLERERRAEARAARALDACRARVRALRLPMRPVDAEAGFDGARVTITFTAEERVDFRQLVRELGAELRCRVELRQVGARDEAKALDGIGPCGQRLCCSRWLTEFQPITIKMAKLQGLALNPGKLAGACGRLKCCLRYEIENYDGAQRDLPGLGSRVFSRQGEGRVVGLNLLERKAQVLFDDPAPVWLDADEVFRHNGCQEGMCESCTRERGEGADAAPAAAAPDPLQHAPTGPTAGRRRSPGATTRPRGAGRGPGGG